jgi:hypothetical protein
VTDELVWRLEKPYQHGHLPEQAGKRATVQIATPKNFAVNTPSKPGCCDVFSGIRNVAQLSPLRTGEVSMRWTEARVARGESRS